MNRFHLSVFVAPVALLLFVQPLVGQEAAVKKHVVTVDTALEKVAQVRILLDTNDVASAKRVLSELQAVLTQIRNSGSPARPLAVLKAPDTVKRNSALIEAEVNKTVLQEKQVWLGVTPSRMADIVWVQRGRIATSKSKRFIILGGEEPMDEKFMLFLLAFPADAEVEEGELRWAECKKLGGTVLSSKTTHRVK